MKQSISKQLDAYAKEAQVRLAELGFALSPLDKYSSRRVSDFAGRQAEATEYTAGEIDAIKSIPNISLAILDKQGDFAHISLGYGLEHYNKLWFETLGYKPDELGGPLGEDTARSGAFYNECSATSKRYKSRAKELAGVAQGLVELNAFMQGYKNMLSYEDESTSGLFESLGASRTGKTKNMSWDGKDHPLYEMAKPLSEKTIAETFKRALGK